MPSETYHLRAAQMTYLDSLVESSDQLDNRSQALKYIINQHRQKTAHNNE